MAKSMITLTTKAGLLVLALVLGGCSYLGLSGEDGMFRDRGSDYLRAEVTPPMQIPNQLDSFTLDQLYVIPDQLFAATEIFESTPMPKPIETRRREGVIIQSLADRRWIVCALHGAAYEPASGRCVGGPCGRGRLTPVDVGERDGQVYWYPSRDIRPVPFDAPASESPP